MRRAGIIICSLLAVCLMMGVVSAFDIEQVTNGGFSSGLNGWGTYVYGDGEDPYVSGGEVILEVDYLGSAGYSSVTQDVDLTAVSTLTFDWDRGAYTSGYVRCYIGGTKAYEVLVSSSSGSPSIDVSGYSGTYTIKIQLYSSSADSLILVDDVSAIASSSSPTVNYVTPSPSSSTTPFDCTLTASITEGYPTNSVKSWSITNSSGWSYKSGYDQYDNPTIITISDSGYYTATCTAATAYDSHSDSASITASEATYNITVNLLNSTGAAFTESTDVSITSGDTILYSGTTTNGTQVFSGITAGTYGVMAQADDYEQEFIYKQITDSDITVNFTMTATGSGTTTGSGAGFAPHYTQFIIVHDRIIPVVNATITATVTESSSPIDWLTDWIGLSDDIDIEGETLFGYTDDRGTITFQMIQSLRYHIVVESPGYDSYTANIYPSEDKYTFNVGTTNYIPVDDSDVNEVIITSVNSTLTSDTQVDFAVIYNDTLSGSGYVNITIFDNDRNQLAFNSHYGDNNFNQSFTLHDYAGESYIIQIEAHHSVFGEVIREYTRTFPIKFSFFGLDDDGLMMAAFAVIIFTGMLFSAGNVAVGSVVICLEGWIFYFIGWLNSFGAAAIMPLILFTMLVFAYNYYQREKEEGY